MRCTKCGEKNIDNFEYCKKCGEPLKIINEKDKKSIIIFTIVCLIMWITIFSFSWFPLILIGIVFISYLFKYFLYKSKTTENIKQIILLVSFAPIIFVIYSSIFNPSYFSLDGTTIGGPSHTLFLLLMFGTLFIPVLPVCLIYQVYYFIYLWKSKNADKGSNT